MSQGYWLHLHLYWCEYFTDIKASTKVVVLLLLRNSFQYIEMHNMQASVGSLINTLWLFKWIRIRIDSCCNQKKSQE